MIIDDEENPDNISYEPFTATHVDPKKYPPVLKPKKKKPVRRKKKSRARGR